MEWPGIAPRRVEFLERRMPYPHFRLAAYHNGYLDYSTFCHFLSMINHRALFPKNARGREGGQRPTRPRQIWRAKPETCRAVLRAPPKASARGKTGEGGERRGDHAELRGGRAAHRGPKGWSGEHTKRSAVRSHGTPRKRQRRAVRRCKTTEAEGCTSEARRAGVASTRSEAQCAATEHRASVSAGRCEDARRQRRRAAHRRPEGLSGEHTKRSAVRSHGTPRKASAGRCEDARRQRREGRTSRPEGAGVASTREAQCAATEHRASVSAGRCEDARRQRRRACTSEARRAGGRAHEAKRSAQPRNTAQAPAQGGAKMQDDHCELWNRRHLA